MKNITTAQEETCAVMYSKVNGLIKNGLCDTNMQNNYKHEIYNTQAINQEIKHNNTLFTNADNSNMMVIINRHL